MHALMTAFAWGEGSFMSKDTHRNTRSNNVSAAKAMATEHKTAQKRLNVANVPKITRHMSVAKTTRQYHASRVKEHTQHGTIAAPED
jgi:hypothetical protein